MDIDESQRSPFPESALKKGNNDAKRHFYELQSFIDDRKKTTDIKLEIKPEPVKKIHLIFNAPDEDFFGFFEKIQFNRLKRKHPNFEFIFVDKDDFGFNQRLLFRKINKYESLYRVNLKTKIKIIGHGSKQDKGVLSNSNAYPGLGRGFEFTARMVANILRLIKDKSIIVRRNSFITLGKQLENYLKISIIMCHGSHFAKNLFEELYNNPNESIILTEISAPAEDRIVSLSALFPYYKGYHRNFNNITEPPSEFFILGIIFILFFFSIISAESSNQGYYPATILAISGIFLLVVALLIINNKFTNSADKCLLSPDFSAIRFHQIPYKLRKKNASIIEENQNELAEAEMKIYGL